MNRINFLKNRIILKFFPQLIKSKDYIEILKYKGINIGKGTYFFSPETTIVDIQRPWMLEIGEYCKITANVTILCHDYSRSVLRRKYGGIIGEASKTIIGNNVFIGINSVILMGAKIGNNVIIGAGSVVPGNITIPDNVVIAGNPARIVKSLDQFYEERNKKQLEEAKCFYLNFKYKYKRNPSEYEMGPFWQLFMPRDREVLKEKGIFTALNGDSEEEIINDFLQTKGLFSSYKDFIKYAEQKN